jgi:hypothetical protein
MGLYLGRWPGCSARDLVAAIRSSPPVRSIYLVREMTDLSFPPMANEVGIGDHTTVVHGWRKVAGQVGEERLAYDWVAEPTREIRATWCSGLVRGGEESYRVQLST